PKNRTCDRVAPDGAVIQLFTPSSLKATAPPSPTARKRLAVVPPTVTLRRFCARTGATGVQVTRSGLVTMVPASPTATYRNGPELAVLGAKVTARSVFAVLVVREVQLTPSSLLSSVPALPVARKNPFTNSTLVRFAVKPATTVGVHVCRSL